MITGERSIGSGHAPHRGRHRRRRGPAGTRAQRRLERVAEAVGAQSIDAVEDRIAALQDELRETKRRLKAGAAAGVPKPTELAAGAEEVAPGVRLVAAAIPYESMEALKGAAKAVRGALGSGVIALLLDADAPQIFVTVSDDLVERGISAGELVKAAAPPHRCEGRRPSARWRGDGHPSRRPGGGPARLRESLVQLAGTEG